MTPNEVAESLLVSPVTVRQWAQKGWLPAETTPGGHRRFLRRDVEAFAQQRGLTLQLPDAGTLRVLVVDDDAQVARFLEEVIGAFPEGVQVEVALDGFDAGQRVEAYQPHIMLLDLMMPGMNGFDVCRRMKSSPATRSIDIIALTGFPTPENRSQILKAGARACLSKPVDLGLLREALGLGTDALAGDDASPASAARLS